MGQIEPQRLQGWWRGDPALNTAEVAPSNGAIADWRYGERVVSMLQKNETMCSIQASQFSTASPGIRSNSRVLPVASISPSVQVCPTIHRSFAPIRSPAASSSARRLPYLMSTGTSRGSTGSAPAGFRLALAASRPLLGAPVARFRRDDGTGEDHLWACPLDVAGRRAVGITQQRTDCRCPADNRSQDVLRLERRVGDVWKLVFRPKRFVLSPFGQ